MTALKARDIVLNAVRLDDFVAISDSTLHSSSVLDMFSFFHQTSDWLKKLQWPDEYYKARFLTRLGALYCGCVDLYAAQIKSSVEKDLEEIELTEEVKRKLCVKVNNLETARSQLDDLMQSMKIDEIQEVLRVYLEPPETPISPESPTLPALPDAFSGNFIISVLPLFQLHPRVYGISSLAYFRLAHPVTGRPLGQVSPSEPTEITFTSKCDGFALELYYAHALAKNRIGRTWIAWDPSYADFDVHERTADIIGLGKVIFRIQMLGDKPENIEFHFRRTFKNLKKGIQDALFTQMLIPSIMAEVTRRIQEFDRKPIRELKVVVYRSNQNLTITNEQISGELNALFDELGDNLGFFSNFMYEALIKQFVRKLWRDFHLALHTDFILSPARFLTIKQLTVLVNIVEALKMFLFGEGEMVPLRHFDESPEYKKTTRLTELYALPSKELIEKFGAHEEIEILEILKQRAGPDEMRFVLKQEETWPSKHQQAAV